MHTIADDKNNLALLRSLRKDLVHKDEANSEKLREDARWDTFTEAVENISCACGKRDLGELAAGVRRIKNLLRRPGVRKTLARLESKEDKKGDKKPEGNCSCADCGKVIDGSVDPCAEGALCVDCGMKDRDTPPGEKEAKKDEKKAKKGTAFPPEMMGQGGGGDKKGAPPGAPQDEPEEEPPEEKPAKAPPSLRKKRGKKKKDKEKEKAATKPFGKPNKTMRAESKLRCRKHRMAAVFEDE